MTATRTQWPRIRRTCPHCQAVCDYAYVYHAEQAECFEECTVCRSWFYIIIEGTQATIEEGPK